MFGVRELGETVGMSVKRMKFNDEPLHRFRIASACTSTFASLKSSYGFYAILSFALLLVSSYNEYDHHLKILVRLAACFTAASLIYLAKTKPIASLLGIAALTVLIGWFAPSLFSIEIVVVVAIFLVSWKTSFSLWKTMAIGTSCISLMYLGKYVGDGSQLDAGILLSGSLISGLGVGFGAQTRRLRVANERLVKLAEADRRNAVIEERRRIARELHDVAAHHLSAVIVKSKLATRLDTAEDLREANVFAATSSTEALDAMRNLVGVLSERNEQVPLAPQPRLDELQNIKNRMESAGLAIDMSSANNLNVGRQVELAVVRIVQESLTNILRHRGPGNAWVSISHAANAIKVFVDDDGTAPNDESDYSTGNGLVSMRERATACGGTFGVEQSPRGGWRIAASFPSGTL
jgi:signal transduction histidine kinase